MQAQSTSAMRGVSSCLHWLPQSPHSPILLSGKAQAHLMYSCELVENHQYQTFWGKTMAAVSLPEKGATSCCRRQPIYCRAWLLLACSLAGCLCQELLTWYTKLAAVICKKACITPIETVEVFLYGKILDLHNKL